MKEEVKDKLREKIKKLIEENKKIREKSKGLEGDIKKYELYKNLIFMCASSKLEPLDTINGLKFTVQQIKKKNWDVVKRIAGTSGNLNTRGVCPKCGINLFGKNIKPSVPCELKDCHFEDQMKQVMIEYVAGQKKKNNERNKT